MNEQNVLDILTDSAVKQSEADRDALRAAKTAVEKQRQEDEAATERLLKSFCAA